MDELTIAFKIESPPSWLPIGRTAENNWRTVEIDCSYWFNMNANGEVVLMYKPSCGMSPYPLLTEREGDNIVWRPKSGELVEGVGRLQAFFEVGTDVIGSSDMISCEVDSSLLGVDPGTDPGQTDLPWALDIIEQIAELSGHYPKIVNGVWFVWDATQSEFVSTGINAQGEDGVSPTVTVTAIDGGHRVTITDADGAHTFDVMDGEGGSGGGADVFIAVRGTTTEAEIRAAHSDGKVVICVYQNRVYYLSDISDNASEIVFRTTPNQLGNTYALVVNGSRWIGLTTNLARKSDIPTVPITGVSVNGTELTPSDGVVDVPVPTPADTIMVVHLTPTSADLSGAMDKTGFEILAAYDAGIRIVAEVNGLDGAFEWNQAINGSMVTQFLYASGGNRELIQVVAEGGSSTAYHAYHIAQLPTVTASDNGKFLRVVNGAWAAQAVPSAESNSFGGGS